MVTILSIREFISSLPFQREIIAGEMALGNLSQDVVLLSENRVWLRSTSEEEFKDTLVCVHSAVFPAYSSTFDLLLRFLQQAGASGILFQGGKRADFSKSTLMLADRLRMPLILIDPSVKYSTLTRHFYRRLTERYEEMRSRLQKVRHRLERIHQRSSSLSVWLEEVERELAVTAVLRLVDPTEEMSTLRARWVSLSGPPQIRCLLIPIQGLSARYQLELRPTKQCPLLELDSEIVWIEELASALSLQAAFFLIAELPGIGQQSRWALSMEFQLFYSFSNLTMFRSVHQGFTSSSRDLPQHSVNHLAHQGSDSRNVSSVERRRSLIELRPVGDISVLWLKATGGTTNKVPGSREQSPYPYHTFAPETLYMREHVLTLCQRQRYIVGTQPSLLSCVPWRDWRENEGLLVFWFDYVDQRVQPKEDFVRDLIGQLEVRLQFSFRAYFFRQNAGGESKVEDILRRAFKMVEDSYEDFLSVSVQSKTVQSAENQSDVANLMISSPLLDNSYNNALQLLHPLLDKKSNTPLLEALEAYLESGGKMQMTAEKLFLHRNTLRYRLKRAEELLGISLDNDETRFAYRLAIRTWRLHQ